MLYLVGTVVRRKNNKKGDKESMAAHKNPYRSGSIRWHVANALMDHGMNTAKAFNSLKPKLDDGTIVFKENDNGSRKALPAWQQQQRLWTTVQNVLTEMLRKPDAWKASSDSPEAEQDMDNADYNEHDLSGDSDGPQERPYDISADSGDSQDEAPIGGTEGADSAKGEGEGTPEDGDGSGSEEADAEADSKDKSESDSEGESGDPDDSDGKSEDSSKGEGEESEDSEAESEDDEEAESEQDEEPEPDPREGMADYPSYRSEQEQPQNEDAEWFLAELRRLRKFCESRAADGTPLDTISMRPVVYGKRMFENGIPYRGCLHALTLHWPQDVRTEAKIRPFDPAKVDSGTYGQRHHLFGYALRLAHGRVPMLLVGPKGSGKSTIARQLAEFLDVEYGECPLTAGATPSWLAGAYTLDGYRSRPFVEIYGNGGVFCFEEMDSADPNMLLLVNNALANDHFYNPVTGVAVERHPDFIATATANTYGLGANRDYTGRERLDSATLDRWNCGRIVVEIDEALERELLFS